MYVDVGITPNASGLILNEVNSMGMDWIELFNPTNDTLDLDDYTLSYAKSSNATTKGIYTFSGDCASVGPEEYILLIDEDAENLRFAEGSCKLPFSIKHSGFLSLKDDLGAEIDYTEWVDEAYIEGHSWARQPGSNSWTSTSTQSLNRTNVFTKPILAPKYTKFEDGIFDNEDAYIQNPPEDTVTEILLQLPSETEHCTCYRYMKAHDNGECPCSASDIIHEQRDPITKFSIPGYVGIEVGNQTEFGTMETIRDMSKADINCHVSLRGEVTREADLKSYSIKFNKKLVPSQWRGQTHINLIKTPWDASGVKVETIFELFKEMKDWVSVRTYPVHMRMQILDSSDDSEKTVDMGRYIAFENNDENFMDRHGLASRREGHREDAHLYKARSLNWDWKSEYDWLQNYEKVPKKNESAMEILEHRFENKDSDDNTKIFETLRELNGKSNLTFVEAVQKRFHMANIAQFMAVNILCGDIDHSGKNLMLASPSDSDKFFYLPWDYNGCWSTAMDHGLPSVTFNLYQEDYLFRNMFFYEELREELYPLLKSKLDDLSQGAFEVDHIIDTMKHNAEVIRPMLLPGTVDATVLFVRPFSEMGDPENGNKNFTEYADNWKNSVEFNERGAIEYIRSGVDLNMDLPPYTITSLKISDSSEIGTPNGTALVKAHAVRNPNGNRDIFEYQLYYNRPSCVDHLRDGHDIPSCSNMSRTDQKFYSPAENLILKTYRTKPTAMFHRDYDEMMIDCSDVYPVCQYHECYITRVTIDPDSDLRSMPAYTKRHARVEDVCGLSARHQTKSQDETSEDINNQTQVRNLTMEDSTTYADLGALVNVSTPCQQKTQGLMSEMGLILRGMCDPNARASEMANSTTLSEQAILNTSFEDPVSAYRYSKQFSNVTELNVETFELDNVTFDDMYNDSFGGKALSTGACISSTDFNVDFESLDEPCGTIHVHGATSRGATLKGFKIKLHKHLPMGKWRGRRDILLIKSPFDSTRMRNAVGYEMIGGVPGLVGYDVMHVNLTVNGEAYGLYSVVEHADDHFLKAHGLDGKGQLLKADHFEFGNPRECFVPNEDNVHDCQWVDPKTGDDDDQEWFKELSMVSNMLYHADNHRDCARTQYLIETFFNVDQLITFLAVNQVLLGDDALSHNYMLYKPRHGAKYSLMFWDVDDALDKQRQGSHNATFEEDHPAYRGTYHWGILNEFAHSSNKLYRGFLNADGNWEKVKRRSQELTGPEGPLSGERFQTVINKYADRIENYVEEGFATNVHQSKWRQEVDRLLDVYNHPEQLWEQFEEPMWRSDEKSTPSCPAW